MSFWDVKRHFQILSKESHRQGCRKCILQVRRNILFQKLRMENILGHLKAAEKILQIYAGFLPIARQHVKKMFFLKKKHLQSKKISSGNRMQYRQLFPQVSGVFVSKFLVQAPKAPTLSSFFFQNVLLFKWNALREHCRKFLSMFKKEGKPTKTKGFGSSLP